MELYIHIPFCVRKCQYCDFLSAPATAQVQNAYMDALLREIQGTEAKERMVTSVFIGGGTPTAVEAVWIARLMDVIRQQFVLTKDAEISMEMNPGTVTEESLKVYKAAGITRLSIGLQSASDEELKRLGRIHNFEQFLHTYALVRGEGFENVNVDLMSGLPGQSLADWERTLQRIMSLQVPPEHISAYSLIVEEGTPFYEMYERGELALPDEDTEREMYRRTEEILKECGYERYEISNYAKPGMRCRHNCGYWTRKEYLGFGVGAASLYEEKRFRNGDSVQDYIANPLDCREDGQPLSVREQMEETMFLGLRMSEGVNRTDFYQTFGVSVEEIYGAQIKESMEEGLLVQEGQRLFLTDRGVDVSNYVMAKFLTED